MPFCSCNLFTLAGSYVILHLRRKETLHTSTTVLVCLSMVPFNSCAGHRHVLFFFVSVFINIKFCSNHRLRVHKDSKIQNLIRIQSKTKRNIAETCYIKHILTTNT